MTLHSAQSQKPPVWSKIFGTVSYSIRFIANFALKFAVFVTMATGVGLSKLWLSPFCRPAPKPGTGCTYMGYLISLT